MTVNSPKGGGDYCLSFPAFVLPFCSLSCERLHLYYLSTLGGRAEHHMRELKNLSPSRRARSGRLALLLKACTSTVLQPRSHGGFLMDAAARPAAQEAT
jgi:hypothetical protein